MRAVRFAAYGGPDVLELVDVAAPHAGPGEIRIAVRAAGITPIDWKVRSGLLHELMPLDLPSGTGLDAAGIVDEVGLGVDGVALGDAVFGTGRATLAEHAVLTDWAPQPSGRSFAETAGYGVAVATATRVLDRLAPEAGEVLLVSGAAGGVGSAVVQIARRRGLTVIGTASAEHQDHVARLGALPTTYGPGLVERVRALAPGGVGAAVEVAGPGAHRDLVTLTGDPARVLSIAGLGAPRRGARRRRDRAALREAARLAGQGRFAIPVAERYGLAEAARAHRDSAAGHVAGRRVVVVAP